MGCIQSLQISDARLEALRKKTKCMQFASGRLILVTDSFLELDRLRELYLYLKKKGEIDFQNPIKRKKSKKKKKRNQVVPMYLDDSDVDETYNEEELRLAALLFKVADKNRDGNPSLFLFNMFRQH